MSIKKTLTGIALAGSAIALTGVLGAFVVSSSREREDTKGLIYAGNIDGKMVVYEQWRNGLYLLRVKTPEGIEIRFWDDNGDGTAELLPENMERTKAEQLYKNILSRINAEKKE